MTGVTDITSESAFKTSLSSTPQGTLSVLYFHAPWAAPCAQMKTILETLAQTYPAPSPIKFLSVNAEDLPEISEDYEVTAVPYLVFVKDGKTEETLSGCDATKVREAIERHYTTAPKENLPPALTATKRADDADTPAADLSSYAPTTNDPQTAPEMSSTAPKNQPDTQQEDINTRLAELVKAASVMLFMKGTPSAPQCGFSRQLVALLRERGVRYGFFNILADEDVRQGLKVFAEWPTYPQLWVGGELVGGLDIVKEELENDPEFFAQYSVHKGEGEIEAGA